MSLLSILAVAICAKPELYPWGVKVRAPLAGAVEQSQKDAGCYGGEDAGGTHGKVGGGSTGDGDGEVICSAAHNLGDHYTADMMDIKTELYLHFLLLS